MSEVEYTIMRQDEIEAACLKLFGIKVDVRHILFEDISITEDATATVFSTSANNIYALCESDSSLRLGDIQHLLKRAGFIVGKYAAPNNRKDYFYEEGRKIFLGKYPGRSEWTDQEEAYYQLLVPYAPALVQIRGIRGPISRFNPIGKNWQLIYKPTSRLMGAGRSL